MQISIFWLYVFLVSITIIIHVLIIIIRKRSSPYKQIQVSAFKLMFTIFLNIVETYRIHIYEPTLELKAKQFNLDPTEKTNSIQAYNKMEQELLKYSASEILTKYILPECLFLLKKYYNMDYIILLIITNLKKSK